MRRSTKSEMVVRSSKGSNPFLSACGLVAQLVSASACHAEGYGFDSRQDRWFVAQR